MLSVPTFALSSFASLQPGYWREAFGPSYAANWALLTAAVLTLVFVAWQAWETRRSAKATQRSVSEIKAQSVILKQSVEVAERNAEAAQIAALAAKANTEALVNSERAWILAQLGWFEGNAPRITIETLGESSQGEVQAAVVNLKLTCRNEGKSPAWIDHVYARIDIASGRADVKEYDKRSCGNYGSMGPIGAGQERYRCLDLRSDGLLKQGDFFSAYAVIEYHDIFGMQRETTIGYSVDSGGGIYPQVGVPGRNRNT